MLMAAAVMMKKTMKAKKGCSLVGVMCWATVLVILVVQIDLTSVSTQHPNKHWTKSQEKQWLLQHQSHSGPPLRDKLAIKCDRGHKFYDSCSINWPTVLDPTNSTFYLMLESSPSSTDDIRKNETSIVVAAEEKIKPYPRKWENHVMSRIQEITLSASSSSSAPRCLIHHNAPALVFSGGGYTGNFFHEFNEGLIPLFITVRTIFPGVNSRDFVMVISELQEWWLSKYGDLLSSLSKHPIIDLNNEPATHCFPSVTVGLISHGFMSINPRLMPGNETIADFQAWLEATYSKNMTRTSRPRVNRPRLVLISRGGRDGRAILNQDDLQIVANKTGFKTIIFEPTANASLQQSYELINSSHAVVGVHGAALTHSLYLRPGAVFIQIVPFGPEDVADICFGKPARDLGLEYIEYKISLKESSLIEKYGKNDVVLKNSRAIREKGWSKEFVNVYMREQNVRVDLVRFREYLKQAYRKAKRFMRQNG